MNLDSDYVNGFYESGSLRFWKKKLFYIVLLAVKQLSKLSFDLRL